MNVPGEEFGALAIARRLHLPLAVCAAVPLMAQRTILNCDIGASTTYMKTIGMSEP